MDFVIRFFALTVITVVTISVASEKWAKYNIWLMIVFMTVAGIIFIM